MESPPQAVNNLARRVANSVYGPDSSSDDDYIAVNYVLHSSRTKRQATTSKTSKPKAKSTVDVVTVNPDLDPSILDSD